MAVYKNSDLIIVYKLYHLLLLTVNILAPVTAHMIQKLRKKLLMTTLLPLTLIFVTIDAINNIINIQKVYALLNYALTGP